MQPPETTIDPGTLGVYGTDQAGHKTITYTRNLRHSIDKVWRAITVEAHRSAWFPELTLALTTGGDAIVNFGDSECPAPEDSPGDVYYCKVTRYEPPNLLEYIGPHEHHRFELVPQDRGCTLTFLAILPDHTLYDDDAETIQTRYSVACGWHYKLDAMQDALDGTPFADEGYAGPIKTKYYFAYRKLDKQ